MKGSYDEAVVALYQAPHDAFVAERKRLAAELKARGDAAGAARLAKLGRPTISAWAVNQLYWHAREPFDALFETAEQLRTGDLGATNAHRELLAKLRARAAKLLGAAGHGASEATLRRVTTTLSALAAAGSFDPDPPGALAGDRDPPGFDPSAMALGEQPATVERRVTATAKPTAKSHATSEAERRNAKAARERAAQEAAAERRRAQEERERRNAERRRLEAAQKAAKAERQRCLRDVEQREKELERAQKALDAAREELARAESELTDVEGELAAAKEEE